MKNATTTTPGTVRVVGDKHVTLSFSTRRGLPLFYGGVDENVSGYVMMIPTCFASDLFRSFHFIREVWCRHTRVMFISSSLYNVWVLLHIYAIKIVNSTLSRVYLYERIHIYIHIFNKKCKGVRSNRASCQILYIQGTNEIQFIKEGRCEHVFIWIMLLSRNLSF